MTEKWWRRLFGLEDEEPKEEPGPDHPHSPTGTNRSIGRFEDSRRSVKVRMMSQYPAEQAVSHSPHASSSSASSPDSGKSEKPASDVPPQESRKPEKRPFRLTQIPSPVYGFKKPPEDFYRRNREEKAQLDRHKEEQERKRVAERKSDALRRTGAVVPPHKEQPVIDQTVMNQPSLQRKEKETDEENHADPVPERTPARQEEKEPERLPEQKEHTAARNRLKRSPHRPAGESKVPFNVLMFGSDHHAARRMEAARRHHDHERAEKNISGENGLRLPLSLLDDPDRAEGNSDGWIAEKEKTLADTLKNFHVSADIIGHVHGPSVTRFDIHLHPGVKINKVMRLSEDIKLSLAVRQVRIATVPGRSAVGIEIPNKDRRPVLLKQILESKAFIDSRAPLTAALGIDVSGNRIVTDLAKMPHGLIAGATGSGKSVCIHSLILSLIYRNPPERLRLLLVDPKVVELAPYQSLPHLAAPVITEPKEAALALKWVVEEMEKRYRAFAASGVRDIDGYNRKISGTGEHILPYIVIIIDELSDLMMVAPQEVEESVCRIAQKARAAGIHLLLATQRPSVDVITGLIKSNIPARIAFSVSSQTDSRTIIDSGGAERLLGRGDMLYAENGSRTLKRIQGCFVSDEEIRRVTGAFHGSSHQEFLFSEESFRKMDTEASEEDDLLEDAAAFVVDQGQASVSSIQRHFRIGYNRAARLVDALESRNIISGANGSKPRQVLMTRERLEEQMAGDGPF
ncbi:DNA translocase FtsK [Sporolactobacillus sp. THM19-2]|uniref:DNA translocase FtsK n=1 Tax=Sporolactobacillus sp. THM19-2 TaxID=2511171 RepID=UPI00101EDB9C|nr:DNA translocase FtsK [Sporolactobacillus sp. THM19-2]RYL94556.1 DNA translocase FtsK [Sporolactobacillus sp. THM19-2]